jgi:Spy/CpxP family protein refolding chaperone
LIKRSGKRLEIMKTKFAMAMLAIGFIASVAMAQDQATASVPGAEPSGGQTPAQAYEDCRGRKSGDTVQHASREGSVPATCTDSPNGLVARPNQARDSATSGAGDGAVTNSGARGQASHTAGRDAGRQYSLEQATSDHAQLNTIAFDGLAFLTGDFGYDTFLPPGKVSDYFGFQYMRDIDAREGGHNTSFLTRIAHNMLTILNDQQKAQLLALAKDQQGDIRRFAEMRLPLIKAFRLNLDKTFPAGSTGLDQLAVMKYSADLYVLDGQLAYQRAKVMGSILRSLNSTQKAALARLKFGDSGTWPDVPDPLDKRSMSHEANVAVMTYASEMFSWYAGSLEADTYFCPERHGMYFGGFGMKTAPAMGKRDYAISTTLTGNSGENFLATLTDTQRRHVTALIDLQRSDLGEIVRVRQAIATELRRFLKGESADKDKVLALSKRYGQLDGKLSYLYANAFAKVGQTLTVQQKQTLAAMRSSNPSDPKGPFLYSTPISVPTIENTDFLFGGRR